MSMLFLQALKILRPLETHLHIPPPTPTSDGVGSPARPEDSLCKSLQSLQRKPSLLSSFIFLCTLFHIFFENVFIYFERACECKRGRGRERKRENLKQTLHCQHRDQHRAWSHKPWDHDLMSPNQESDAQLTWVTQAPLYFIFYKEFSHAWLSLHPPISLWGRLEESRHRWRKQDTDRLHDLAKDTQQ